MLINSLDEARRTVAASASLNLCMAKLDQVKVEELPPHPTAKIPSPWVRKPRAEEAYYLPLLPHLYKDYEDEPSVG